MNESKSRSTGCRGRLVLGAGLLAGSAAALAQAPAPRPTLPAPATAAAAPAAAPASAPATASGQRVEITGGRQSDTEQRRQSTASKIVIGREEIDKFGDATVGEVLRRLPGVNTPGAPGRGGPPRLRGLGGGFTQLLIDGQRVPPGFSLESLTPEQVERIEILRAPTAETGARAIAGTINIITREGFRRRLNDLRIGAGLENSAGAGSASWTHNDNAGDLNYTLSGSVFKRHTEEDSRTLTQVLDLASDRLVEDRTVNNHTRGERYGVNATARLQWRLNSSGDSLALMPSIFHSEGHNDIRLVQDARLLRPSSTGRYAMADVDGDSRFTVGRVGLMWRQRLGDVRMEANGNAGGFQSRNLNLRREFGAGSAGLLRTLEDRSSTRESSTTLNIKGTQLLGGKPDDPGSENTVVVGAEIESVDRHEERSNLENGLPVLADFGDNLKASSLRLAAYAQNEWRINPHWSAYAGLRWEGITTHGDSASGTRPTNRSSVWTPLAQAVWKPDPKSRDQVRMSLTRSYRSPGLSTLIARPSINRDRPVTGPNDINTPDSAGNPELKPELATGIEIGYENYMESGGVLSVNYFRRNISDLIRGVKRLETVDYSPFPRWVLRQQNIGKATVQGVELEARFRLDQLLPGSPRVEIRSNLSLFDSQVNAVPGPDNRLEQQAKGTANIGADYRLRGTPFTLGGNVNWVPGYTTRTDANQTVSVTRKQVWDVFALWSFNPNTGLRLLANNLAAEDFDTTTVNTTLPPLANERSSTVSGGPSYINWQLRLELKL
jgi:outer membrane receptor for ferrienterochelin and colicins